MDPNVKKRKINELPEGKLISYIIFVTYLFTSIFGSDKDNTKEGHSYDEKTNLETQTEGLSQLDEKKTIELVVQSK